MPMTPAALDRWLAEHVMGWHLDGLAWCGQHKNLLLSTERVCADECPLCDVWHPTANIAQAIECAEKARADGRIVDWTVSFDGAFVYPTNLLSVADKCAQGEIRALSLCRALHAALS